MLSRRGFLKTVGAVGLGTVLGCSEEMTNAAAKGNGARPNVILCMADDLGWGDTGYNGNKYVKTPNLDVMVKEGIRFNRFYSGAPVCSPTRGSCLTGRHPYRYGIFFANVGHMRKEEFTLAEALKTLGYRTGHFGKWHLGTLTKTVKDSNRGGTKKGANEYSPPWENGFDECFSTEAKVPTWDPMLKPAGWKDKRWWNVIKEGQPAEKFGTHYWTGPGQMVPEDKLRGNDSKLIMDRAINFIERAVKEEHKPFFAVIWFHTPHWPVVAGEKYKKMYEGKGLNEFEQNYFGAITAMDEQIGRLRSKLRELGVEDDTMLWFCSDNGPEGMPIMRGSTHYGAGSAGPLRGRKRSLYEGGIRVPGLLVWPRRVKEHRVVDVPCSTSDYLPTVLDAVGFKQKEELVEPIDGMSLLGVIDGKQKQRGQPIGFESKGQAALIEDRYKLYSPNKGKKWELYDITVDIGEKNDIADEKPDVVKRMAGILEKWRQSCKKSLRGEDYKRR